MLPSPSRDEARARLPDDAWATDQAQAGMAVLLNERNLTDYAEACRDCARGLIETAREWKKEGRPDEVARLVTNARWYWRRYIWEIAR